MNDYDCPVAEQAREAHQSVVDMLSGYRQRFQAQGSDRDDRRTLVDTIDQWLAGENLMLRTRRFRVHQ